MNDPIDRIVWLKATDLNANGYNPNVVFNVELRLLELSILLTGWTQPILVNKDRTIIDGFHRWRLSQEKALLSRYEGMVPCAVLDVDLPTAMLLTIRMNRAKGTHVALRMSAIVKRLIDEFGLDRERIAEEIGGSLAEVDLLYQDSIFRDRDIANYRYSKAWIPIETGRTGRPPDEK